MSDHLAHTCCECGEPIYDIFDSYQLVHGFEKKRERGGANTIYLRQPQSAFMCIHCMDRRRKGLYPTQGGLL